MGATVPVTGKRLTTPPGRAIRVVVAGFGVLAGLAAIEHGSARCCKVPAT